MLGEPKVVQFEKTHISNLDSVENEEMRKILEAGKPALGNSNLSWNLKCRSFGYDSC